MFESLSGEEVGLTRITAATTALASVGPGGQVDLVCRGAARPLQARLTAVQGAPAAATP